MILFTTSFLFFSYNLSKESIKRTKKTKDEEKMFLDKLFGT